MTCFPCVELAFCEDRSGPIPRYWSLPAVCYMAVLRAIAVSHDRGRLLPVRFRLTHQESGHSRPRASPSHSRAFIWLSLFRVRTPDGVHLGVHACFSNSPLAPRGGVTAGRPCGRDAHMSAALVREVEGRKRLHARSAAPWQTRKRPPCRSRLPECRPTVHERQPLPNRSHRRGRS